MFSSRLDWGAAPNRLSSLLERRRAAGLPVLDLTESNPTRAGGLSPGAEILEALAGPASLLYEPSPLGALPAREAVSAYYAQHGHDVDPGRILLTASTSEAYAYAFKLLCEPGDEVLVPRPSYPLFEFLARLENVRIVHYPLVYHGRWQVDFDALESAAGPRTRAVAIVNPNNPTGSFLKRHELPRLAALCRSRQLAIIADEVFADYAFAPDPERVSTIAGRDEALVLSFSGLSKIAALPQMKLGWIVAGGPPELCSRALGGLELIADTYLSVSAPVQHAAPHLLAAGASARARVCARVSENLAWLRTAIAGSALGVLDVEGGWYATLRLPRTRSEEEWTLAFLDHDGVLVQPGYFFDFESEAFIVLSLLTVPETFREGVARLLARVSASL